MTGSLGRVYAIATAVVVFFVAWALIAARPWATTKATAAPDKRLVALDQRQRRLRAEAIAVRTQLNRRWTHYKAALARRQREIAEVRQLWAAHEAAVARARAAATVHYVYAPAATGSASSTGPGGSRTVTSVRTVVVGSRGGTTQTRTTAPSGAPAPTTSAPTTQAPAPSAPAPAPSAPAPAPPPPPPPPPPPVVSSPPSSHTHSS